MRKEYEKYVYYLLDLDGVIWRGEEPLRSNILAVRNIIRLGGKVYFISNNSTRSRLDYVNKLRGMGLDINERYVINSAYAAAYYIAKTYGKGKALVLGEEGLYYEFKGMGFEVYYAEEDVDKVDYVVVGLDRRFNYVKLANAVKHILKGALFIATNEDSLLPVGDAYIPGAGAMVAAVSAATDRRPVVTIGKPNTFMVDLIVERDNIDLGKAIVIGDRLDTDVAMANKLGVDSILVLTGIAKREDVSHSVWKPTYIVNSLLSLFEEC